MTAHLHDRDIPGCYRCELSREETLDALIHESEEFDRKMIELATLYVQWLPAGDQCSHAAGLLSGIREIMGNLVGPEDAEL